MQHTLCHYIHVTVRHYRFIFNNQTEAQFIQIYSVIKPYMFRTTTLTKIRSPLLYIGIGKFHTDYDDRF